MSRAVSLRSPKSLSFKQGRALDSTSATKTIGSNGNREARYK